MNRYPTRHLDVDEVLLSTVAATTDAELHAARMATIEDPTVFSALAQPWSPPSGYAAGATLLGEGDLHRRRTVLRERLGWIRRRLLAEGVGRYLLPPAERSQPLPAIATGDEGAIRPRTALALVALAGLLFAAAPAAVNGAWLLGIPLLALAYRPLARFVDYREDL